MAPFADLSLIHIWVLMVPGDCPALDRDELDALLDEPADSPSVVIVPDRHGSGTNACLLYTSRCV